MKKKNANLPLRFMTLMRMVLLAMVNCLRYAEKIRCNCKIIINE